MPDRIAVKLSCLEGLLRPVEWRHLRRMADQRVTDSDGATVLLIDPGHAFYQQRPKLFEGCKGEMPTADATAEAEATKREPIAPRPGFPAFNGYDGAERWRELHEELHPSAATIEHVISRVCPACQPRARALLKLHPIDWTSLDAYRRSTVVYHDAVNADVGNPIFGYEAAAKLYGW